MSADESEHRPAGESRPAAENGFGDTQSGSESGPVTPKIAPKLGTIDPEYDIDPEYGARCKTALPSHMDREAMMKKLFQTRDRMLEAGLFVAAPAVVGLSVLLWIVFVA